MQTSLATAIPDPRQKRLIDRLARIEGQLRGVQRMIGEAQDCEAVAQQLAAARGALDKAFFEMIACALEHRLVERVSDAPEAREDISDIVKLLGRYA